VRVQEPNIKGLTKLWNEKIVKGKKRKRRRRKTTVYNQQAWRRYNHVKVKGWSPCGLHIHIFLMFKPVLMLFELILYFFV
jgi:hypothetical protein